MRLCTFCVERYAAAAAQAIRHITCLLLGRRKRLLCYMSELNAKVFAQKARQQQYFFLFRYFFFFSFVVCVLFASCYRIDSIACYTLVVG